MVKQTFEQKIKRLEEIVAQLESGECPLEEVTALYDEGVKLSAECDKTLSAAMQKITDISAEKESGNEGR